tara:strand:+ start:334 stop:702 length:369 start_codon:yes stop_codon:yes gene_type:complete
MANPLPLTAASTAFVPKYNFKKSNSPNTRVVKFGDGYEHRTTFGLNQNALTFNLTFEVSETDADRLTNFFDTIAVSGANFSYQVPGESSMIFVVEGNYSKTVPYLNRARVQVTFRQVFEPES